jgi:hypothetical protein
MPTSAEEIPAAQARVLIFEAANSTMQVEMIHKMRNDSASFILCIVRKVNCDVPFVVFPAHLEPAAGLFSRYFSSDAEMISSSFRARMCPFA